MCCPNCKSELVLKRNDRVKSNYTGVGYKKAFKKYIKNFICTKCWLEFDK